MLKSQHSIPQQPGSSEGNTLIIDMDSIAYMIGWHHREHREKELVEQAIDSWFSEFLTLTDATDYLGVLGAPASHCFRYDTYKFKPYKGNRIGKEDTEETEWIRFWEPIIKWHLITAHKFLFAPAHLETDDIVAAVGLHLLYEKGQAPIICSPDKDLKQIPGFHLNYKPSRKKDEEAITGLLPQELKVERITATQAHYNWCMQMLCGDTADNIAGVVGMGEKKATELLKGVDELEWNSTVERAYEKQFGPYYGNIIHKETKAVVTMMTPEHPFWDKYGVDLSLYLNGFQTRNLCTIS